MARFEQKLSITSTGQGRANIRVIDRINVDDVYLHLVRRELFRLKTGVVEGVDVDPSFKDFLVRTRYTTGGKS